MKTIISNVEVYLLKTSGESRPHWVSHFIVPTANEVLVKLKTNDGAEGFGLATNYTDATPTLDVFTNGLAEQIIGMNPLEPEKIYNKLFHVESE